MARQGIFRYFPGADNANANNANPTVDRNGDPVKPANATGDLAAIDLFGNCTYAGTAVANCRTYGDPLRSTISTSAYMQETLKRMPIPNEFTGGDGLNTAIIRFTRRVEGLDLANGNGTDVNRDQYTLRIDHQFNSKHKLSVVGTREKTWSGSGQAGQRAWPTGFDGLAVKRPDVYIISFTSFCLRRCSTNSALDGDGQSTFSTQPGTVLMRSAQRRFRLSRRPMALRSA